eukprot:6202141-Prymnesium_polylepis.2
MRRSSCGGAACAAGGGTGSAGCGGTAACVKDGWVLVGAVVGGAPPHAALGAAAPAGGTGRAISHSLVPPYSSMKSCSV